VTCFLGDNDGRDKYKKSSLRLEVIIKDKNGGIKGELTDEKWWLIVRVGILSIVSSFIGIVEMMGMKCILLQLMNDSLIQNGISLMWLSLSLTWNTYLLLEWLYYSTNFAFLVIPPVAILLMLIS
jgi:hypothetical protein